MNRINHFNRTIKGDRTLNNMFEQIGSTLSLKRVCALLFTLVISGSVMVLPAAREIVRLTNEGELHFLETSGGHLFICQKSLSANESAELAEDDAFHTIQTNTNVLGEKK